MGRADLMLAVNPKARREPNDYYATDSAAIIRSLDFFEQIGLKKQLWECACGQGNLSKPLIENGYDVFSSDLIDRGFGEQIDFLNCKEMICQRDIITNPPFRLAEAFVRQADRIQDNGNLSVFFCKIQFLETKKRKKLFSECGLKYVGVFSDRIACAMNGDFSEYFKYNEKTKSYRGGTQFYSWFVFQKGFLGNPQIFFI